MRSLWMDPLAAEYEPFAGELNVDVAVIGAGLTGIGAASALSGRDVTVAVFEQRTVASGASGRNAGFVLAGPSMNFLDAVRAVGEEATLEIWELTRQNNALIARLVEDLGLNCGFLRRGSMSLAATPQEWEALRANAEALLGAGMQVSLAAAEDLPIPFHRLYHGGLYYTGNGEVDPAAFVRGVARSLDENIHIFERTSVQGLKRMADRWVLQLEGTGTEVRAGAVLIASNAYTPSLLDVPINPTRGQVISTAPLGRVAVPFPMYANLGYQYWRQTADGRLVVGGWRDLDISGEVGTDEILHDSIQDQLDIFCREVGGHDISVEHRWAGVMGFSPDGFPMVGQVPGEPGLWIAAGYSGHGVAMAFTCGALVARRALGDAVFVPRAFATERFEIALRRGQEEPAGSR